jgi:DNA transformation protein
MRHPDQLTAYVQELLAPIGPVAAKRMFGGVGLFHGGLMFGLIARQTLFLKVGDTNRPAYQAAGEAPFSYDTKQGQHTIASYWRCPPEHLDDPDSLIAWVRDSIAAAAIATRKKPRSSGNRAGTGKPAGDST